MMRAKARIAGRAILAVSLLAIPFASTGGAHHSKKGKRVTVTRVGAGAYYKKINVPRKHRVIHVLSVKLAARSSVDVALAGNALGNTEFLSSLAGRSGAIAAVNGDFGTLFHRPWGVYGQDGHLIQTERSWSRALSVNAPEDRTFMGHPRMKVTAERDLLRTIKVHRVNNGEPDAHQVALYTPAARTVEVPPERSCAARMFPIAEPEITATGAVSQPFQVDEARCDAEPLARDGGSVIAARRSGTRKQAIKELLPGDQVTLTWSFGLPAAVDVIGGNPLIVADGKVLWDEVDDCGFLCGVHPRTGAGITQDGKLLLVVVDGRRKHVPGMSLKQFARFFVAQGADRAMNFDGGGASEMWIQGTVVNRPSDGHERALVNAILVLPGTDEDQPDPEARSGRATYGSRNLAEYSTAARTQGREAVEAAAADPGSLGGLADYLDRRGAELPEWMEQIARDIRATNAR